MATPPVRREEAQRRIDKINDCLRRGFRPPGHNGSGNSALTQAADELGVGRTKTSLSTLSRFKAIYGIEPDWSLWPAPQYGQPMTAPTVAPQPVQPAPLNVPEPPKPTMLERLKKGPVVPGPSMQYEFESHEINQLRKQGHNIREHAGTWVLEKEVQPAFLGGPVFEYVSRPDNSFVFGATSDNHLGSKYERLDVLNHLYDVFGEEGADRVYNAGNWIDGEARFNKFDLHTHGMDAQLAYFAEHYPRRGGMKTYAVAGDDHEGWYGQREGVDIGRYAEHVMQAAGRDDWVNLGYMEAHVKLVNANTGKWSMLAVVHPGGGSSYALSYSIQKIIESLDGGEKPAVGLYGHYHKLWSGNIRNVWVAQTGCTEDQTPFMRKKKLEAHVGGFLIKLTQDPETGAITRFRPEMLRFFNRGFYNHRWSHGSQPIMPDRGV